MRFKTDRIEGKLAATYVFWVNFESIKPTIYQIECIDGISAFELFYALKEHALVIR